jgi:hypothetical protein
MAITTFVTELKGFYKDELLDPAIQEEYLSGNVLDLNYIQRVLQQRTTGTKFNDLVNSEFGTVKFTKSDNQNEVDRDLFFKHYKFANFPNVRGWIGYFNTRFELLLTREALYEYILGNQNKVHRTS